jgi:F-type H+-transporting ATPase subunit delta
MNDSKISVRYSKALFESAVEKNILDKVNQDMLFIAEICKLPEMKDLLTSPVIFPSRKTEILHKMFEGNIEKITMSMIDLAVSNGRESFIPAIARVFVHETMRYRGITKSMLTTAVKVDQGVKKQITEMIEKVFKTKVEMEETIDSEIIGGFILRVDDSFIDASLKSKLRKISKELRGSALSS